MECTDSASHSGVAEPICDAISYACRACDVHAECDDLAGGVCDYDAGECLDEDAILCVDGGNAAKVSGE